MYTDAPFIPIPRHFLADTQGGIHVDSAPDQRSGLEHICIADYPVNSWVFLSQIMLGLVNTMRMQSVRRRLLIN